MIDVSFVLAAAVLGTVVALALARWLLGAPRRRWRRIGLAAGAMLVVSAVAAWRISKATAFQLIGDPVVRVETAQPVVALTFDDGPSESDGPQVLDVLRREAIHATFFVVGSELARHRALGRDLVAAGHELGNHSYTHPRMLGRSLDVMRREIEQTDDEIRRAGGRGPILFRPPNGKRLVALPWLLRAMDRRAVLWDVAPDSTDPDVAADAIVAQVLADVRPGSIILLHVMARSRATSRAALPGVIHGLKQRGFRFVTVRELLAIGAS